jgi:PAS domain S-box-containing protein
MFWVLFERSSNPVALLDEGRRFVDVNEAALALLGQTRGGVIGRYSSDLMVSDERADAINRWRRLVERGEDSGRQTFVRPDGSEVQAHFAGRMTEVDDRRLAVFVVDTTVPRASPAVGPPIAIVTHREREVIRLIALGATTREIAAELWISPETVRSHVRNAMRKLDVRTRAQLVAICLAMDPGAPATT